MRLSSMFYVISFIVWWGFLINGAIIRQEIFTFKLLLKDVQHNPLTYIIGLLMPQFIIVLFIAIAILDYKSFKEIIVNHYTKTLK